jgi:hypothetical protein
MKPLHVKRPRKLLERHWPWLLFGILSSCGLFFTVTGLAAGMLEDVDPIWFGRNMRGYTAAGYLLGILAVFLAALSALYSVRKRSAQEAMPFQSSMVTWLWSHVYLGLIALVAALFHGGYGVFSLSFSTGKLLLWIFALLIFSGIAWRLVYRYVPTASQDSIRNYSQHDTMKRAKRHMAEIDKIAAGQRSEFRQIADWILHGALSAGEIRAAAQAMPPDEQVKLSEIQALADRRRRALTRHKQQGRLHRILQSWRLLHIPLVGLFVIFFVVHLIAAFDIPGKIAPAAARGFADAQDCKACHATIVAQWEESMHAHALESPVTVVQTNQVAKVTLVGQDGPDPLLLCNNCHGPVGTAMTGQPDLPLESPLGWTKTEINEGVNCTVCHQYAGEPVSGGGGLASVFQADLKPGRVFFGSFDDPVGNAYHRSETVEFFEDPSLLCQSCHNVNYDINDDGRIEPGVDLILQTTYDEYIDYRADGGDMTCIDCHMAPIPGETRLADRANIPLEQDFEAPDRVVHSHGFVGVDYPLDTVAQADPQREEREALLESAARIEVGEVVQLNEAGDALEFDVSVTNIGAGHQLPTGFAFARQMWLEVVVSDQNGNVLLSSGVLANPQDDLCDQDTLSDALADFAVGCPDGADPQLVNFQQKLLDIIDIKRDENGDPILNDDREFILAQGPEGEETWLQHLTSGAVARVRPFDGQVLARINPEETVTFTYAIPVEGGIPTELNISVRLLFRNLPPYFLRVLAANQPPNEVPQIGPIIQNLLTLEMAGLDETFVRSGAGWSR